jgi:hypothetical protein
VAKKTVELFELESEILIDPSLLDAAHDPPCRRDWMLAEFFSFRKSIQNIGTSFRIVAL